MTQMRVILARYRMYRGHALPVLLALKLAWRQK